MKNFKRTMAAFIAAAMATVATAVPAMAASVGDVTYTEPAGFSSNRYDSNNDQQQYEYANDTVKVTTSDGRTSNISGQIYVSGSSWSLYRDVFTNENLHSVRDKTAAQWIEAFLIQTPNNQYSTGSFETIGEYEYLHFSLYHEPVGYQTLYWDIYVYIDANGKRYGFSYYSANPDLPNINDFRNMMQTIRFTYPAQTGVTTGPVGNDVISIYVNGSQVFPDADPFIMNDRTMVPIRVIAEALGYRVDWDGATQCITMTKGDFAVQVMINSTWITKYKGSNPPEYAFFSEAVPIIQSDRTFLPVRAVAEAMGCAVDWDGSTRSVFINQ